MFAVFNRDSFVNWWGNSHFDLSWIELTIGSQGWDRNEVDVVRFDARPQSDQPFTFNDEKEIVTLVPTEDTVGDETKVVYVPGGTTVGEFYYAKGVLLK